MIKSIFFVVLEQVFWAASGLVMSVLLFRSLTFDAYALFVTLIASSTLFQTLHNTFIIEPMVMSFDGKKPRSFSFNKLIYVTILMWFLFCAGVLWIYYQQIVSFKFDFFAFAVLGWGGSLFWMFRRYQMLLGYEVKSAVTTFVYSVSLFLCLFVLFYLDFLSLLNAFLFYYSLAVLFVVLMNKKNDCSGKGISVWSRDVCSLFKKGWNIAPISFSIWIQSGFVFMVLQFFANSELVSMFRAEYNLILPMAQFNSTVSIYLLGKMANGGIHEDKVKKTLTMVFVLNVFYSVAMLLLGGDIFYFVYGSSVRSAPGVLPCLVLSNFLLFILFVYSSYVKVKVVQSGCALYWWASALSMVLTLSVLWFGGELSPYYAMIGNCLLFIMVASGNLYFGARKGVHGA